FVDKGDKGTKVKATAIEPLGNVRERVTKRVDIRLRSTGLTTDDFQALRKILINHQGPCPVFVHLGMPNRIESTIAVDERVKIKPSDGFIADVERVFGKGTVAFN
ncbi:MAG TPA: hypothetical protein VLB09_01180, partial [Nitrospiria bacterium]|nr:hypothetical protein [Nitrospiria bacterium]